MADEITPLELKSLFFESPHWLSNILTAYYPMIPLNLFDFNNINFKRPLSPTPVKLLVRQLWLSSLSIVVGGIKSDDSSDFSSQDIISIAMTAVVLIES